MYRNYVILPRPDNRRRVFPLGKIGFASGRRGRGREWTRRLRLTGENRNGAIDRVIGSTRGHFFESSSRDAAFSRFVIERPRIQRYYAHSLRRSIPPSFSISTGDTSGQTINRNNRFVFIARPYILSSDPRREFQDTRGSRRGIDQSYITIPFFKADRIRLTTSIVV